MNKKYELPENEPQMASEPVAAYALRQEHTSAFVPMSVHKEKDVEAFARKICSNEENFQYHKLHGFYKGGIPEDNILISEQQLIDSLDEADAEGYISEEETNHLMSLWQVVS